MFEHSVTCDVCGTKFAGQAEHPLKHCENARAAGWEVPEITENKPIRCPSCKIKSTQLPQPKA